MSNFDLFESDSIESNSESLENLQSTNVKNLGNEVKKLLELKKLVAELESNLSNAKQLLRLQETEVVPELMISLNCNCHGVDDSLITIEPFIQCSIPSRSAIESKYGADRAAAIEKRNLALVWLETNKLDGIIKNEISVDVGKDQHMKQKVLVALASVGVNANVERNVNAQTLKATIKDLRKQNIDVPKDIFNLYEGQIAKIKTKKK